METVFTKRKIPNKINALNHGRRSSLLLAAWRFPQLRNFLTFLGKAGRIRLEYDRLLQKLEKIFQKSTGHPWKKALLFPQLTRASGSLAVKLRPVEVDRKVSSGWAMLLSGELASALSLKR
jgi:hypothetical protein